MQACGLSEGPTDVAHQLLKFCCTHTHSQCNPQRLQAALADTQQQLRLKGAQHTATQQRLVTVNKQLFNSQSEVERLKQQVAGYQHQLAGHQQQVVGYQQQLAQLTMGLNMLTQEANSYSLH